jgi:hypothetical protein
VIRGATVPGTFSNEVIIMRFWLQLAGAATLLALGIQAEAQARGFGGARAGGYRGGARGGAAYGGARYGAARGAYGGYRAGGSRGGTYVGPRGGTVQAGRRAGVAVGPYGGVHAGGAKGARVTTPSGRTYTTGSRGRVSTGPYGGVRASGARGGAVRGPSGTVAAGRRGAVAAGPYGGVAVRGSRGVAVGHATRYYSPAVLRSQATVVRGRYYGGVFTSGWYRSYPGAWYPYRWRVPNYWVAPVWSSVAVWCGITARPIVYDYGSNVVIQNNYVYVDGEQTVSTEKYADQADKYVERGRKAKLDKKATWQALGVFGMIQGEEKYAQHIFQLAVNKDRIIRGNYYNAVADESLPVRGAVNKKTQRAAWSIGKKKNIVFETGLDNLTKDQATLLVHYGKERTEQMVLVRLEEPKDDKNKNKNKKERGE